VHKVDSTQNHTIVDFFLLSKVLKEAIVKSIALIACCVFTLGSAQPVQERPRLREFGTRTGVLSPGRWNAITDVAGVKVGHVTLIRDRHIRTGVTAVLPHGENIFQQKVPGATYAANGFGKLMGVTQVEELGNIETPLILTNTLSVPTAADALIGYVLEQPGNETVRSVNPVVGETNDGYLNDIRGRHVKHEHILEAIRKADTGPVEEGAVGAGTGTICFGFKGGIGTASRILPENRGGYTVGVLVQSNFGGVLRIGGYSVGERLKRPPGSDNDAGEADGSCMVIVATDAPLDSRNLKRLAKRALLGIPRTGGYNSNGSGDYAIAFSTAPGLRIPYQSPASTLTQEVLRNAWASPLFQAAAEAAEEAILNSLFKARDMDGRDGHRIPALPLEQVRRLMKEVP